MSSYPASEPWVRFYSPSLWRPVPHLLALLPLHPHTSPRPFFPFTPLPVFKAQHSGLQHRQWLFFSSKGQLQYVICPVHFGNQWHTFFFLLRLCHLHSQRADFLRAQRAVCPVVVPPVDRWQSFCSSGSSRFLDYNRVGKNMQFCACKRKPDVLPLHSAHWFSNLELSPLSGKDLQVLLQSRNIVTIDMCTDLNKCVCIFSNAFNIYVQFWSYVFK